MYLLLVRYVHNVMKNQFIKNYDYEVLENIK